MNRCLIRSLVVCILFIHIVKYSIGDSFASLEFDSAFFAFLFNDLVIGPLVNDLICLCKSF